MATAAGGPMRGADGGNDPRPTFDEVVERYGRKIYTIALHLTGNTDDAADLTQDVFLRVYGNLDRYQPGTFDGWLYRITRNLFLDRARRKSRLRMEPLPEGEWRAPASTEPGPADVLERATLEAVLEEGLAKLAPDFRLAVVLCDVEGLSYDEIVAATGWPLGTVRSRIHRGRRALRDHLATQPPPSDGGPDHGRHARDWARERGDG
ncbi:MAG: sigma-70 family RNA polymerase sigma factor [Euzebyales bacterium]|nr:sigma-70 family RNA polymerase sigma factor [Euzebyales bacterium]